MSDTPKCHCLDYAEDNARLRRELAAVTAERDALVALVDKIDIALADIEDIACGDGLMVSQARTLCRLDLIDAVKGGQSGE